MGPMGPNIGPKPGPRPKSRAGPPAPDCPHAGLLALGPGLGPIFGPMGPIWDPIWEPYGIPYDINQGVRLLFQGESIFQETGFMDVILVKPLSAR